MAHMSTATEKDSWHVVKTRLLTSERDELEQLALRLDRSVASVLRLAVREYLKGQAPS